MIPLLAAPLVALLACTAGAQQQKAPITPLEGVWREPLLPDEKEKDRFGLSCSGDKIAFNLDDQHMQGTFEIGPTAKPRAITITVSVVDGRALPEKRVYSGLYCLEEGTLYLRILPPTTTKVAGRVELPKQGNKALNQLEKARQEASRAEQELARVKAEAASFREGRYLDLAPITFQLEKLKK
jgi:hypothetical protein